MKIIDIKLSCTDKLYIYIYIKKKYEYVYVNSVSFDIYCERK